MRNICQSKVRNMQFYSPDHMLRSMSAATTTIDWPRASAEIADNGYTTLRLLDADTCRALAALYSDDTRFRSRVVMQRHNFGRGEYKYLAYPLPETVANLRRTLYPPLAAIANEWRKTLGEAGRFPATLKAFLAECHAAGQTRPTPLLLRYGADDFNCLHQDLYGPLVFPLQLTLLLSAPGTDFSGGEFVLVEQRPRAQSRPIVVPLSQGEAVIFPVHHRPAQGTRGPYRVTMRHGVSRVISGLRQTLGIIFHDAA
jgi:uncharacterized protein